MAWAPKTRKISAIVIHIGVALFTAAAVLCFIFGIPEGKTILVCGTCRVPTEVVSGTHEADQRVAAVSFHQYETAEGKKDYRIEAEANFKGFEVNYNFAHVGPKTLLVNARLSGMIDGLVVNDVEVLFDRRTLHINPLTGQPAKFLATAWRWNHPRYDRPLDGALVEHGQHTGQAGADRADIGIGPVVPGIGLAGAEDLGGGVELNVSFQSNYGFVFGHAWLQKPYR